MAGRIASAATTEWRTPGAIIGMIRAFFRRDIDLDPCGTAGHEIAGKTVLLPKDGLALEWGNFETVFVNPPFGTSYVKLWECITPKELKRRCLAGETKDYEWRKQTLGMWVEKAEISSRVGGSQVVMLIPAAVDTAWWQGIILPRAAGICFIKGRVKFDGNSKGPATMPCALVYFGEAGRRFRVTFKELGRCLWLP